MLIREVFSVSKERPLGLAVVTVISSCLLVAAGHVETIIFGLFVGLSGFSPRAGGTVLSSLTADLQQWIGGQDAVAFVVGLLLISACLKALFTFSYYYYRELLSVRLVHGLRTRHLERLTSGLPGESSMKKLKPRIMEDSSKVAAALRYSITNCLYMPIKAISTIALCVTLSWMLSLAVLGLVVLIALPVALIHRRIKRINTRMLREKEAFLVHLVSILEALPELRVLGGERGIADEYSKMSERVVELERQNGAWMQLPRVSIHVIGVAVMGAVAVVGHGWLALPFSDLTVFCMVLFRLHESAKNFGGNMARIYEGRASWENMQEAFERRPSTGWNSGILCGVPETIIFDQVSVTYDTGIALHPLSFAICTGQVVALTGGNGVGKSTALKVLSGLVAPTEGRLLVDGKEPVLPGWWEQIGLCPQTPTFFEGTAWSNLDFGRAISSEELSSRCEELGLNSFFGSLGQGHATHVSRGGTNLSAGQRKVLALARSMIDPRPILVWDEPSEALDEQSILWLQNLISVMRGSHTIVLATHDLRLVQMADQEVVVGAMARV